MKLFRRFFGTERTKTAGLPSSANAETNLAMDESVARAAESRMRVPDVFADTVVDRPDDAARILFEQALLTVPALEEGRIREKFPDLQCCWRSTKLFSGTAEEMHKLVVDNLERIDKDPQPKKYGVKTYRNECAQIEVMFRDFFIGIRMWHSTDCIFACGNSDFRDEYGRIGQCKKSGSNVTVALSNTQQDKDLPEAEARVPSDRDTGNLPRDGLDDAFETASFTGDRGFVEALSVLRDGAQILSAGTDTSLKLWDVKTGSCVTTFHGHYERELSYFQIDVCLSSTSYRALSGAIDGTLRFWDLATGKCLMTLTDHEFPGRPVSAVCLSPSDRFAVSASGDEVVFWDIRWDKNKARVLRRFNWGYCNSLCTTPDGRCVVAGGGSNGIVSIAEFATGRRLLELEGHRSDVRSVSTSADGRRLLSGSWDHTLKLWEISTGRCIKTFEGHTDSVLSAWLSPNGRWALSGSSDKTARLWDSETGQCIQVFAGHDEAVGAVSASNDMRLVVSGGWDGMIKLWSLSWRVADVSPRDWEEGARGYLETFLTVRTPYATELPWDRNPSEEECQLALTRRGKPSWTEDDFKELLHTLGYVGHGCLRPEGVKRELEEMAADWEGPPPLLKE